MNLGRDESQIVLALLLILNLIFTQAAVEAGIATVKLSREPVLDRSSSELFKSSPSSSSSLLSRSSWPSCGSQTGSI